MEKCSVSHTRFYKSLRVVSIRPEHKPVYFSSSTKGRRCNGEVFLHMRFCKSLRVVSLRPEHMLAYFSSSTTLNGAPVFIFILRQI